MSTQQRAAGRGFLANMKIARQVALIGFVGLFGLITAAGIMFTSNTIISRMMDAQNIDFDAMSQANTARSNFTNVYRLEDQFLRTKKAESAAQVTEMAKKVEDGLIKLQGAQNRSETVSQ